MRDVIVVGAGGMGRAWLDTIARRDDLRVVAVVDVSAEAARTTVAERGWEVATYTDVDEALRAVPAHLLLNVTIPEAHLAVSAAAVRAGVPVLSEKPITPTVAEALVLAALSAASGVAVAASQSRRYSAGIHTFREALTDLGGAEQVSARFFQNPRFGGFRDQMDDPLLVDMAIHTFDQARYLLDAEPEAVYCESFSPSWSWYAGDAAAEAVFRFAGGARFSYTGSWCSDGLTTSWNGEWSARAAGGSASWNGETDVVRQGRDEPEQICALPPMQEGLDAALAEFVTGLEGGPVPSGLIARNVWSLAMVEGAIASSRSGQPVQLADVFGRAREQALSHPLTAEDHRIAAVLRSWSGAPPI